MRSVLIVFILLMCLSLGAFSQNAMTFMQIPPSSISRAMGGGFIGVADVWHSNPFVAWDNPAMPAMHEGIAYGITRYDYFNSKELPKYYYNVGMVSMGYRGLGLLLPSVNPYGNLGTYFDTSYSYNLDGGSGGWNYTSAKMYGISFNPLMYLRTTNFDLIQKYNWLNVSAGLALTQMEDDYWVGPPCKLNTYVHTEISVLDAGLLARVTKQISPLVRLEGSMGYKKYNITKEKQEFPDINKSHSAPVGQNDVYGMGVSLSIPKSASNYNYPIKGWTDNLATVRLLADRNSSHNIVTTYSTGIEMGLVDTFFLRGGNHTDLLGHDRTYRTWGAGVNLHCKDFWELEFNLSRDEQDDYLGIMDSWDAMVRVDGVKIWKHYNKL